MNLHWTRRLIMIAIATITLSGPATASSSRLDQTLGQLADAPIRQDSLVDILVILDHGQVEQSISRVAGLHDLTRADRIQSVVARLKSTDAPEFHAIEQFLVAHSSGPVNRQWIIPSFRATVPISVLQELAGLPGVDQVINNEPIELTAPVDMQTGSTSVATVSSALQLLNVPSMWHQGLTGKGRLVCSFDTGVEESHPALSTKWRGNHVPLHTAWFSKVAPDTLPYDKAGHGTHTMGVMIGSTPGDTIGVAPDAEWIAAGVIDQGPDLTTTISQILEAFQWALDPDSNFATTEDVPDVILNSWGLSTLQPASFAPCSTVFWQAIDNVEAAGIVTIFAAGNEGKSGDMTIRNPANRATTPYNSFCVGAVNDQKVIADFSSRGPSSCDTTQIKPEVVAPGVGIRSSYKGGTYVTMSGTSMAAPFIAGLVVLCRQYNPDATVEQIKEALMRSAGDLGPAGEDNSYGWGLVDASKLIQFLPAPNFTHLSIVEKSISGDGIAMPGESCGLQIYLSNPSANVDYVVGQLVALDDTAVTITAGTAGFFFGPGGTLAVNSSPFGLTFRNSMVHGTQVPLKLRFLSSSGALLDSATIRLTVGYNPPGSLSTHHTGAIDFTVSDFGQLGLGASSIYNAGGEGFRFNGSPNLLYEAGLIVGRSAIQLSTGTRDSLGQFRPSDFRPKAVASSWVAEDGSSHQTAVYSDNASPLPVPVTVSQESMHFPDQADDGFVVLTYRVINSSLERLTGLNVGLLADFDLSGSDSCVLEPGLGLIYQEGGTAPLVGLVSLAGNPHFSVLANDDGKLGFGRQQQYSLIASHSDQPDSGPRGDKMILLHSGPFDLGPQDTAELAFAFVAGSTREELLTNAVRARERFSAVTSVDDPHSRPNSFELAQNYPNPFNPSTTISFALPAASDVTLEIYNLLGQRVLQLYQGHLAAGSHRMAWSGLDSHGTPAAAGVYLYRLAANGTSQTRKMVLLK